MSWDDKKEEAKETVASIEKVKDEQKKEGCEQSSYLSSIGKTHKQNRCQLTCLREPRELDHQNRAKLSRISLRPLHDNVLCPI